MNLLLSMLTCVFKVPTASVCVEGSPALNRVRWAHTGKEIATGDSEGQVQVYDVGEVRRHSFLLLIFHSEPEQQKQINSFPIPPLRLLNVLSSSHSAANLRSQGR